MRTKHKATLSLARSMWWAKAEMVFHCGRRRWGGGGSGRRKDGGGRASSAGVIFWTFGAKVRARLVANGNKRSLRGVKQFVELAETKPVYRPEPFVALNWKTVSDLPSCWMGL